MSFPFGKSDSSSSLNFAARLKQGTFLVVDDFDSMRKVTMNQLKHFCAHKMIEAANDATALKILVRTSCPWRSQTGACR